MVVITASRDPIFNLLPINQQRGGWNTTDRALRWSPLHTMRILWTSMTLTAPTRSVKLIRRCWAFALKTPLPTRLKPRSVASQLGLKKNSLIDLSSCINISCSIITDSSAFANRVFPRFPQLISRPLLRGYSSNAASSTTSTKS
jgi:hypothetical protein